MTPVATVHEMWRRFQARDWAGARTLLADDATLHWVSTGEHFDNADAIIKVNAIYPEGWSIRVVEVSALADGRVLSVVEVRQDDALYFATSLFSFNERGLIHHDTEYWATFETPPDWRTAEAIGAYRRD